MEAWMEQLMKDVGQIAGPDKTAHYRVTVLPQIFADFYKMLQGSGGGKEISEQYRMEDGSMEITLCGKKETDGKIKVTTARAYKTGGALK